MNGVSRFITHALLKKEMRVGSCVGVWYRYPHESRPRSVRVVVRDRRRSIADGVARAIARDHGWTDVRVAPHPAMALLALLRTRPTHPAAHAFAYAAVQPPRYKLPSRP